jgi:hypothetical protein
MTLRHRLYQVLNYKKGGLLTALFSWTLTVMVLANIAAVILESVNEIEEAYGHPFYVFEVFSIIFFTIEYALRLWTAAEDRPSSSRSAAQKRLKYVLSFHGMIDLLAILPFFLNFTCPHGYPGPNRMCPRSSRGPWGLKISPLHCHGGSSGMGWVHCSSHGLQFLMQKEPLLHEFTDLFACHSDLCPAHMHHAAHKHTTVQPQKLLLPLI